jgi:hypothetical protein
VEEPKDQSADARMGVSQRERPGPRAPGPKTNGSSNRPREHGPIPENHAPLPQWWWDQTLEVRRVVAIVVVVVLIGGITAMVLRSSSSDEPTIAEQLSPAAQEARLFVATLPPARIATWDQLAECESEGDWAAATGNGYYGGLQFSQTTWLDFGGTGSPHEATREEQIMRGEAVQAAQGWGAWPRCSATLGLSA